MTPDEPLEPPAPEDGVRQMLDLCERLSPSIMEHAQCWKVIAVRAGTNQVMCFGEGENAPGNTEMMDEAILMVARQILERRQRTTKN